MYEIECKTKPISIKPLKNVFSRNHVDYLLSKSEFDNIDENIKKPKFDTTEFKFQVRSYDLVCLQEDFKSFYLRINDLISEQLDIFECLNILREAISDQDYKDFINQLSELITDHIHTPSEIELKPINFESFRKFILFSLSKKVRKSEIRIDPMTGNFCLYHSDKNDHKSRKISLIFNEKEVVFSVLSRDYGLARVSGRCALKQPDANHKIDLLMDLFKF